MSLVREDTEDITFTASLAAIPASRGWVVAWAARHGVGEPFRRLIALLTTELVTNAVRHGPEGGEITVSAAVVGDEWRVAVRDESPQLPRLLHVGSAASGGRGVMLVDRLSSAWGVDRLGETAKSVWFRVGEQGPGP